MALGWASTVTGDVSGRGPGWSFGVVKWPDSREALVHKDREQELGDRFLILHLLLTVCGALISSLTCSGLPSSCASKEKTSLASPTCE